MLASRQRQCILQCNNAPISKVHVCVLHCYNVNFHAKLVFVYSSVTMGAASPSPCWYTMATPSPVPVGIQRQLPVQFQLVYNGNSQSNSSWYTTATPSPIPVGIQRQLPVQFQLVYTIRLDINVSSQAKWCWCVHIHTGLIRHQPVTGLETRKGLRVHH